MTPAELIAMLDPADYRPSPAPMPAEGYCPNGPECADCRRNPPLVYPQPKGPFWFASIDLAETVHAVPLGFTRFLFHHLSAPDALSAFHIADAWCRMKALSVNRIRVTPSTPTRPFCFPEAFLDAQIALAKPMPPSA